MPTAPKLPRSLFQSETHRLPGNRARRTRGVGLAEVMIAALIFTIVAMSIGTMFLQNNRQSLRLRYRTNAVNVALNVLEQIRVLDFDSLSTLYASSATVSTAFVRVITADPTAPDRTSWAEPDPAGSPPGFGADKIPLKYQNLDLVINVRDGVTKTSAWNTPSNGLALESGPNAARLKMRFWLTLNYNETVSGDAAITAKGQVYEIVLVYQWKQPGATASSPWESGTVRAVVQNPNPKKPAT